MERFIFLLLCQYSALSDGNRGEVFRAFENLRKFAVTLFDR
jgi:hypothetical protein